MTILLLLFVLFYSICVERVWGLGGAGGGAGAGARPYIFVGGPRISCYATVIAISFRRDHNLFDDGSVHACRITKYDLLLRKNLFLKTGQS